MKNFITIKSSIDNISLVESFVDDLSAEYRINEDIYGNIIEMLIYFYIFLFVAKDGNKLTISITIFNFFSHKTIL